MPGQERLEHVLDLELPAVRVGANSLDLGVGQLTESPGDAIAVGLRSGRAARAAGVRVARRSDAIRTVSVWTRPNGTGSGPDPARIRSISPSQ